MAIPYAKDSDVYEYDSSLKDAGEESFEKLLIKASNDILNLIKGTWWPSVTSRPLSQFDEANLNEAALLQLTVYKALSAYIFPSLSKFSEGDIFKAKADHYAKQFKDEWAAVKGLPLYDFDESATFDDDERPGPFSHRVRRG